MSNHCYRILIIGKNTKNQAKLHNTLLRLNIKASIFNLDPLPRRKAHTSTPKIDIKIADTIETGLQYIHEAIHLKKPFAVIIFGINLHAIPSDFKIIKQTRKIDAEAQFIVYPVQKGCFKPENLPRTLASHKILILRNPWLDYEITNAFSVLISKWHLKKRPHRISFISNQLLEQATHDHLTGLPNRKLLLDSLSQAITFAKRTDISLAVLFVDVDHFKEINDQYGHQIGDLLLQQISTRLKKCIRESDTLARLGGDEFVIILLGLVKKSAIIEVIQKIRDSLRRSFQCFNFKINVSVSIGISLYPQDGRNSHKLISLADKAMYQVKKLGRNNYKFYEKK